MSRRKTARVYSNYRSEWNQEQIDLRAQIVSKDTYGWKIPKKYKIEYKKDSDEMEGMVLYNEKFLETEEDSKSDTYIRYVGGVDISFTHTTDENGNDIGCAGLFIMEYPSMKIVHKEMEFVSLTYPYISGFLAFREVEHLVKLANNIKKNKPEFYPDIILVDGNGIWHYRKFGLAAHLGVLLDIPTIGVAKNFLKINKSLDAEKIGLELDGKLDTVGQFCKLRENYTYGEKLCCVLKISDE